MNEKHEEQSLFTFSLPPLHTMSVQGFCVYEPVQVGKFFIYTFLYETKVNLTL